MKVILLLFCTVGSELIRYSFRVESLETLLKRELVGVDVVSLQRIYLFLSYLRRDYVVCSVPGWSIDGVHTLLDLLP